MTPENLSQTLAAAIVKLDEAQRHLKAEQDAGTRLMQRFCKAMGTWSGPWDNAVETRLRLFAQENKCE